MNSILTRRKLLAWGSAATAAGVACSAYASNWPTKPINVVIPFPPGNTADLAARSLQEPLSRALGQSLVVDNRAGAGGNLALQAVARGEKDGHQLLLSTASPLTINPSVYKNPGFDAERDFAPVAIIGSIPMVLITNKAFPAKTLPEFVSHVRANASRVTFASVGNGTFTHLGMELFSKAIGVKLTHVPYRGASPAHTDLVGGRVDFMFDSVASSNALLKADRINAIATTGLRRSPFLMETPTVMESGVPGLGQFEITVWVGLFAPTGTPRSVVQRLNSEVATLLRNPAFRAQLAGQFIRADDPLTSDQFGQRVSADRARWGTMAKEIGLDLS